MGGGVDSAREAAHHGYSGIGELVGEFLRAIARVVARLARSDHADRMAVALEDFAKDVKHGRRIMNLSQESRVVGRGQGEDFRAMFSDEA